MKRLRPPTPLALLSHKHLKKSTTSSSSTPASQQRILASQQVAIIIPVHNAEVYLSDTLASIISQTYPHKLISVHICNDASTDTTPFLIQQWQIKLADAHIRCVLSTTATSSLATTTATTATTATTSAATTTTTTPTTPTTVTSVTTPPPPTSPQATGAGNAKNIAVSTVDAETTAWLCFLDADDIMCPTRIAEQHALAMTYSPTDQSRLLLGSGFTRLPIDSTTHYTKWCNSLTKEQLYLQQYREVTIIQPTWFLSKTQFDRVGGYQVQLSTGTSKPIPSDLIFFLSHLNDCNGIVDRVMKPLIIYRYLTDSVSWKIKRKDLLKVRLRALERKVLSKWNSFTIWGAGRDGKNVLNELKEEYRIKCVGFCDIDEKKIQRGYHNPSKQITLPIVHFSEVDVNIPLLICVAMYRTNGELEKNISSLRLKEGVDYWHVI